MTEILVTTNVPETPLSAETVEAVNTFVKALQQVALKHGYYSFKLHGWHEGANITFQKERE